MTIEKSFNMRIYVLIWVMYIRTLYSTLLKYSTLEQATKINVKKGLRSSYFVLQSCFVCKWTSHINQSPRELIRSETFPRAATLLDKHEEAVSWKEHCLITAEKLARKLGKIPYLNTVVRYLKFFPTLLSKYIKL